MCIRDRYLQKGGRIGKVTATAGTLLQIKPIITFADDGQLKSIAKVRGRNQVISKLIELTVQRCGEHRRYNLAVANGGAPEEMLSLIHISLDGGRIFFLLVDAVALLIFKRRVPEKYQAAVNTVGFVVLMGFMLLVTLQDVWKLIR